VRVGLTSNGLTIPDDMAVDDSSTFFISSFLAFHSAINRVLVKLQKIIDDY